ncbi:MBL fold metallo-hydrolase [Xanthomonas sp. AmX2]|uniref:MBL fold metallo-hydrolase n=1 Tax=Xanthomonas sp. TaxID=29446 RepID=UPI0019817699|nr:MBL fold metallo-hydrolase [Xanthomonas sp.]MBN6152203.1 MBL fold metallo-hydrolase [Xanthomonas sp.]
MKTFARSEIAVFFLAMLTALAAGGIAKADAKRDMAPSTDLRSLPQVPGVYRFSVGSLRISALSDGTVPLDLHQLLRGIKPEEVDTLLQDGFAKNPLETSINTYVIASGERVVLVDTGAGELFGPVGGKLPASLEAAGYKPEQITDILITHIHTDHSGGLVRAERMFFPNATVHVAKEDVDYFLDKSKLQNEAVGKFVKEALATVGPYLRAGKVKTFKGRTEILPGITAIPTPGHTPGHSFYLVKSGDESIEFWGDIMHVGKVQFAKPSVTITFDVDQDAARDQRIQQFAQATNERQLVAVGHLPFPGIGHLRRNGDGYDWLPAEYRNRD